MQHISGERFVKIRRAADQDVLHMCSRAANMGQRCDLATRRRAECEGGGSGSRSAAKAVAEMRAVRSAI